MTEVLYGVWCMAFQVEESTCPPTQTPQIYVYNLPIRQIATLTVTIRLCSWLHWQGSFSMSTLPPATRLRALCMQGLLQAHTERLEQQNQAHTQQLLAQHASELHSRTAALTAQLQQQLHTDVEKAASKHAADVTQRRQLLEKSDALLAAEKQKTNALKVGRSDVNAQRNKLQIRSLKALPWSCVCDGSCLISCIGV